MITYDKFLLSNGLRVIVHTDKSTPMVCMNILYDVGARDEDENKTGFAHLFEHLMFGGSINIPNYDEPLQKAGGENNAFTTNDITNYYLTLPSKNIETAFWLESDRMLSLAFTDKSLEVQRNVVIEEFKQRYFNQPYGDVWLALRPLAYKKHPYKWATIGKEIKHIEDARMEDVKAFFEKFYAPNNAILVVAGDIATDKAMLLTEKWFGSIPRTTENKRDLPKEPKQTEERKLTLERDVPLNSIYKAYHMCSRRDKDYFAIDVMSDILSKGNSSRLYNELIKGKQLFSEINAYVTGDIDEGLFIVSGNLNEDVKMEDAEKGIDDVLNKLKNELVNERELTKVKNKIESSMIFSEMGIQNKALGLAIAEHLGDAEMVNTEIKKYMEVTSANVKDVAIKILQPANCSTLYYLSKKVTGDIS